MKILRSKTSAQGGNALIATVIVTAVIGTALTAYLSMVKNQNSSTMRSQAWNNGMPVIEAGIEDALSHLAAHGETNLACDNWTQAGNLYYMKRWVGDSYYVVTISNWFAAMTNQPVIESRGFVTMPVVVSAGGPVLAQAGGGATKTYLGRGVRAQAKQDFVFTKGLVAKDTIDMNGNNIETDSFDSMDPNASTNGQYTVSKRKFNGDIASNSQSNTVLVDVGNANIRGTVSTGPYGEIGIKENGKVGDETWFADAGATGLQPGAHRDDMNVDFMDVTAPYAVGFPPTLGFYVQDGVTYNYRLATDNYYSAGLTLKTGDKMIVTGNATLYVNGTFRVMGDASITVAPGASLKLYLNGTTDISGQGIANKAGFATNCYVYGLPNCTSMSVGGNASFIGCIYAPQAHLTLNGGGATDTDFIGAAVVRRASLNGHFKFHYDEALRIKGPPRGYVVTAWNEMSPAEIAQGAIDYSDSGVIY